MTALSTGALSSSPLTKKEVFIPFVAFMQINFEAGYGKRQERRFEYEKVANNAEKALTEALVTAGYVDEFSSPIKFTLAFGESVARLTINGNVKRDHNLVPKSPTLANTVINTNQGVVGFGCVNSANREADPYIVQFATDLAALLESIVENAEIMSLEVAGIKFGKRGRTF